MGTRQGQLICLFAVSLLIGAAPDQSDIAEAVLLELDRRGAFLLSEMPSDASAYRLRTHCDDVHSALVAVQVNPALWHRFAANPDLRVAGLLLFGPPREARDVSASLRHLKDPVAIRARLRKEPPGRYALLRSETREEFVFDWWCTYVTPEGSGAKSFVMNTRIWLKKDPTRWRAGCTSDDECPDPAYWRATALSLQMARAVRYYAYTKKALPASPRDLPPAYGVPVSAVWDSEVLYLWRNVLKRFADANPGLLSSDSKSTSPQMPDGRSHSSAPTEPLFPLLP